MKVMPRLPPLLLVVLSYTYVSTGTSSQRSGMNSSGFSQLWLLFWMANSGVPTTVPAGTLYGPTDMSLPATLQDTAAPAAR
jgi:hypothetical protein